MTRIAATLGLSLLLLAAGAAAQTAAPAPPAEARQILVMLPLAPPHFRPDADYPGGYDVRLGHAARRRTAAELAQTYGLTLAQDWPMPALGVDCYVMKVAAGESMDDKIRQLERDRRVESVQPMHTFEALGHQDPMFAAQPSASQWHLDELHAVASGRGVRVAVVDSGTDASHPDLAGQVAAAENFVDGSPYAPEEHGTAVAGIIAALADNGLGIAGIAPGARVLALRACWQSTNSGRNAEKSAEKNAERTAETSAQASALPSAGARCDSLSLAKALQFALDRDVRIVNLSLGGPPDVLLGRLLDVMARRGIAVVAASDPSRAYGGFPASHPRVLSVGAQEEGTDQRQQADVLAPGKDIPTTEPGARWGFVSGSSFAAAHVSGLLALMLELQPALRPEEMMALLGSPRRNVEQGARANIGRIDACSVIGQLAGRRVCHEEPAAHVVLGR